MPSSYEVVFGQHVLFKEKDGKKEREGKMPIILIAMFVFSVVCIIGSMELDQRSCKSRTYNITKEILGALGIVGLVVTAIMIINALFSYPCNLDTASKIDNFYEDVVDAYSGSRRLTIKQDIAESKN